MATINQPQRRESDLDIVLKGLQAIGGIMDIKKTYEEGQRLKAMQEQEQAASQAQAAELERQRSNKFYPGEITARLGEKKLYPVPEGATGDVNVTEISPTGEVPRTLMSSAAYDQYKSASDKRIEDARKESDAAKDAIKTAKEDKIKQFDKLQKVADDYRKASKDTETLVNSHSKVEINANNPEENPAKDMALIFNYMKILDPASTVREGEQAQAGQTRGIPDLILQQYNRAVKGTTLLPEQRKNFLNSSREMTLRQLQNQRTTDKTFENISEVGEVDFNKVRNPLFSEMENKIQAALNEGKVIPTEPQTGGIEDKAIASPQMDRAAQIRQELLRRRGK